MSSGSIYSHTSILLKEFGIPTLLCNDISQIIENQTIILINKLFIFRYKQPFGIFNKSIG